MIQIEEKDFNEMQNSIENIRKAFELLRKVNVKYAEILDTKGFITKEEFDSIADEIIGDFLTNHQN